MLYKKAAVAAIAVGALVGFGGSAPAGAEGPLPPAQHCGTRICVDTFITNCKSGHGHYTKVTDPAGGWSMSCQH